jgi:tetratricopeptide (TPR) repeat protein
MKNFITAIITLLLMQGYAQEIKTKEQAIKVLESIEVKDYEGFYIINTITKKKGYEDIFRYMSNVSIENEFLNIKACNSNKELMYNSNKHVCYKIKEFSINLADTIKLKIEKVFGDKGTKEEDFYGLKIISNDFEIHFAPFLRYISIPPPFAERKKDYMARLAKINKQTQDIFDAINFLKLTFDPNEKEELKLAKLKDEATKTSVTKEITEEQRKYIVQANYFNDAKDYTNALIMYQKAIAVNKVSYPNAYFNMALIYAELNQYYQAKFAMKQYLILAPDAEDARKAQDKIYEWELNIEKI